MIEVHKLAKRFGPVEALRDVSFRTRKGTITVLIGENGAGKTTTLRCLLGFLRPDSGAATVAPGRIAYVPDRPVAFPGLDGWEILGLAGRKPAGGRPGNGRDFGASVLAAAKSLLFDPAPAPPPPRLVLGRERQEVRLSPGPPRRARPAGRRRALLGPRSVRGQVRPRRPLRAAGRRRHRAPELPHAGRDGEDRRRLRRPAPGRDDRPRRAHGNGGFCARPGPGRTSNPCSCA